MDFRFFDNYPSKKMRFLRSHDTLSLFLHDIMTCMHISKKYNKIHGGRTNLTIRKHAKKLTTPHKFRPKTLDSTDTVDFTHFRRTVNRYCDLVVSNFHNEIHYHKGQEHMGTDARKPVFGSFRITQVQNSCSLISAFVIRF